MKKLATLALLLSLGAFAFGCTKEESAPATNGGEAPAAAPTDGMENGAADHAEETVE